MPTKDHSIDSPTQLQRLASEDPSIEHALNIILFAPLAHSEVLQQCRDYNSRYAKNSEGQRCGLTDYEYLNIDTLAKAWRDNWKTLPVTSISRVTFDLTLPEPDEGVEQVRWEYGSRTRVKIHPPERETTSLVNTLLLEMHMRSRGRVKMDVVSSGEGVQARMGMITSYIEALETQGRSSTERSLRERSRPS